MSAVVLVKCSGCPKRYPVNPKKHVDRDVRFCPFCKTPKKIRGKFGKFLFNPKWKEEKEEQAWNRRRLKETSTRPQKRQTVDVNVAENLLALSALSIAIAKRQMEVEKEQVPKSEEPNP